MSSQETYTKGVSVVICCHNSEHKIPETLRHVQKQVVSESVRWEVVIVDNASDDDTLSICRSIWDTRPVTQMRIVREDQLGLVFARLKGFQEAKYEFVSFVDDDNWVACDWVSKVHDVMSQNPDIGAVGGLNSAVFEADPPPWFPQFEKSYAVGKQAASGGDISRDQGVLCGAGLSIRKPAWDHLSRNGFSFSLVGRQGDQLLCGEDYELCLAIRLAGWKIWYEPTLRLEHFMPASRINWGYLRKLIWGVGYSHAFLKPYYLVTADRDESPTVLWRESIRFAAWNIVKKPRKLALTLLQPLEGDPDALWIGRSLGLFWSLLRGRRKFKDMIIDLRTAAWVKQAGQTLRVRVEK